MVNVCWKKYYQTRHFKLNLVTSQSIHGYFPHAMVQKSSAALERGIKVKFHPAASYSTMLPALYRQRCLSRSSRKLKKAKIIVLLCSKKAKKLHARILLDSRHAKHTIKSYEIKYSRNIFQKHFRTQSRINCSIRPSDVFMLYVI